MNDRRFLHLAFTLASLGLSLSAFAAGAKGPNIIWLIGEDFSPDLACSGVKEASSPNLDRLAAQGMRFNRMFAAAAGRSKPEAAKQKKQKQDK